MDPRILSCLKQLSVFKPLSQNGLLQFLPTQEDKKNWHNFTWMQRKKNAQYKCVVACYIFGEGGNTAAELLQYIYIYISLQSLFEALPNCTSACVNKIFAHGYSEVMNRKKIAKTKATAHVVEWNQSSFLSPSSQCSCNVFEATPWGFQDKKYSEVVWHCPPLCSNPGVPWLSLRTKQVWSCLASNIWLGHYVVNSCDW